MLSMRILHLVGRSQRRGAELVALELAPALDRLGHENIVRACAPGFDATSDPALPPLTTVREMGPRGLLTAAWQLRRSLRDEPCDIVLAHGGWAVQVSAIALARRPSLGRSRAGRPLVVWQRILGFNEGIDRPGRHAWWRLVCRRTDAAVALTPEMGDELRALRFRGPIWPIGNFRRPDRFVGVDRDRAAARLREELGLAPAVPLLGLVGHLIQQKRPERALDVLGRVRAQGLPAHLVVAGAGPLRDDFVASARARDLTSVVHVLGHRDDVEHVLGGIDLLLLTSDSEGIPGVVIEALMTGCPVVTFPFGAVAAVVDNGRTGVVLARADTELMAASVTDLLRDPPTRRAMSEEGRRRAEAYSTENAARVYADHLEQLLEQLPHQP